MASSKWSRHAVTVGGGLAVLGLLALGAYKFPQVLPKSVANIIRPAEVTTALVQVAPVSEAVYGTGTVEPERWAKVVPLQRRRLVDICRCEGQSVRAGQVLARQDDAEERNLLQELEINHEQLDRNLRRARDDKAPRAEIEQKETAFDQSKSRIAAQRARLDSLLLKAPMDGLVLRRDGEIGEIVGPTEVPFWVGQPAPLQVLAEINEEEIVKVAVGQKVFLRTEAFAGQPLRAEVAAITPKGDPTRKTFRVYLRLPPQTPLRIGMTVEANIIFREKPSALVVPSEAVIANTVQEVGDNGRIRRVPVRIGVKGSRSATCRTEPSSCRPAAPIWRIGRRSPPATPRRLSPWRGITSPVTKPPQRSRPCILPGSRSARSRAKQKIPAPAHCETRCRHISNPWCWTRGAMPADTEDKQGA
jgi:RND family efflux transporter MFP subunit